MEVCPPEAQLWATQPSPVSAARGLGSLVPHAAFDELQLRQPPAVGQAVCGRPHPVRTQVAEVQAGGHRGFRLEDVPLQPQHRLRVAAMGELQAPRPHGVSEGLRGQRGLADLRRAQGEAHALPGVGPGKRPLLFGSAPPPLVVRSCVGVKWPVTAGGRALSTLVGGRGMEFGQGDAAHAAVLGAVQADSLSWRRPLRGRQILQAEGVRLIMAVQRVHPPHGRLEVRLLGKHRGM